MASKNSKAAAAIVETPGQDDQLGELCFLPLNEIDFESFPNCRTSEWQKAQSNETDGGTVYSDLVESIKANGQKSPIVVRRKPGNRNKLAYECVAGFRRGQAIKEIASLNKDPDPQIKCIVKELTDLQAHEENVFENATREDLSGPELAFAANNLLMRYQAAGIPISITKLAARMGKNQGYLSTLLGIVTKAPAVAEKWRNEATNIGYKVMAEVADLPANEQEEGYANAKANKPVAGRGAAGRAGTPLDKKSLNKAESVAGLLGRLVALKHIRLHAEWSPDFLRVLGATELGQLPKDVQAGIVEKAKEAFQKAIEGTKAAQKAGKTEPAESEETADAVN